jgi:hypothetical protein
MKTTMLKADKVEDRQKMQLPVIVIELIHAVVVISISMTV